MMERLSASSTFLFKVVFPAVWSGGVGLVVALAFLRQGPGRPGPWVLAVCWLLGTLFILRACGGLKQVSLERNELVVSNYRRQVRVPVADIAAVTQNRLMSFRPITVVFRRETPFGQGIVFMPPFAFRVISEDPVVARLRRLSLPPPREP